MRDHVCKGAGQPIVYSLHIAAQSCIRMLWADWLRDTLSRWRRVARRFLKVDQHCTYEQREGAREQFDEKPSPSAKVNDSLEIHSASLLQWSPSVFGLPVSPTTGRIVPGFIQLPRDLSSTQSGGDIQSPSSPQ